MSTLLFANVATTSVAGGITNTATSVNLAAGTGALFPQPTSGQYYIASFYDALTGLVSEIVHVTNMTSDVATIVRAQEGTTARAWLAGDFFSNLLTAGTMQQMLQQGSINTILSIIYFGVDTSVTANQITVASTTPAMGAQVVEGQHFSIRVANTNTGASVASLGGYANVPITRGDGTALQAGDMIAGEEIQLVGSGASLQIQNMLFNVTPLSQVHYGTDTSGAANTVTATVLPSISALVAGMIFNIKIANTNTNSTTINIQSTGSKNLLRGDLSPLQPADITQYQDALIAYDGTQYQLVNVATGPQTLSFYVNGSTGNDSNTGLSTSTAFATMNGAIGAITTNYSYAKLVNVYVATGTYAEQVVLQDSSFGLWQFIGNESSPANVIIDSTGITNGKSFWIIDGANAVIRGFYLKSQAGHVRVDQNSSGYVLNCLCDPPTISGYWYPYRANGGYLQVVGSHTFTAGTYLGIVDADFSGKVNVGVGIPALAGTNPAFVNLDCQIGVTIIQGYMVSHQGGNVLLDNTSNLSFSGTTPTGPKWLCNYRSGITSSGQTIPGTLAGVTDASTYATFT